MGARLTPEVEQQIIDMYTHRLRLLNEADQYTIEKIADKLGVGKNSVWSRVNGMVHDGAPDDSYPQKLETRIRVLEAIIAEAKQGLFVVGIRLNRGSDAMLFEPQR